MCVPTTHILYNIHSQRKCIISSLRIKTQGRVTTFKKVYTFIIRHGEHWTHTQIMCTITIITCTTRKCSWGRVYSKWGLQRHRGPHYFYYSHNFTHISFYTSKKVAPAKCIYYFSSTNENIYYNSLLENTHILHSLSRVTLSVRLHPIYFFIFLSVNFIQAKATKRNHVWVWICVSTKKYIISLLWFCRGKAALNCFLWLSSNITSAL